MIKTIKIGTAVTCPTTRIHPAIIVQAASTVAEMLPGRFILGVGSGENPNEHILGAHWLAIDLRHEMLEEAVDVIRLLGRGEQSVHSYEQVANFARRVASIIASERPDLATVERSLKNRPSGSVYVDHFQNARGKSVVAPYSARPRPGAPVSAPLDWAWVR